MYSRVLFLVLLLTASLSSLSHAVTSEWNKNDQVSTRILIPYEVAPRSGEMIIGIEQTIAPKWHVYWKNPGDAGFPPSLNLPEGSPVSVGSYLWPQPERYPFTDGLTSIGYEKRVIYPVKLKYDAGSADTLVFEGSWGYLVCYDACVPYDAPFKVSIPVGDTPKPDTAAAEAIDSFVSKVPPSISSLPGVTAQTLMNLRDNAIMVRISGAKFDPKQADLFFEPSDALEFLQVRFQEIPDGGQFSVFVNPLDPAAIGETYTLDWTAVGRQTTSGLGALHHREVVSTSADMSAVAKSGTSSEPSAGRGSTTTPASNSLGTWLWMLLLGLAGGLILNVMPCVLPILSLKLFGVVKHASEGRRGMLPFGLGTTFGILLSYWALAGAAVLAKLLGGAVGWGVQFQEPVFVGFLTVVVVLFCLNLWGMFEVTLPSFISNVAGGAHGPRHGLAGHITSGVFATLMATPCSAPMLGPAVGFALSQSAPAIFAMFTAVGLGMAAPYLALAVFPQSVSWLPKPGVWMDTLRGVMGFMLAATAVLLFSVLGRQLTRDGLMLFQLALLVMGLLIWLAHRWQYTAKGTWTMRLALLVAVASVWLPGTVKAPAHEPSGQQIASHAPGAIPWQHFEASRIDSTLSAGQAVFVDVTADWCFTCKVNEKWVIETPEVKALFAEKNVLPLKADWTNRSKNIGDFLASYGKYGIPFYVLYVPGKEPVTFSEILTKDAFLRTLGENL